MVSELADEPLGEAIHAWVTVDGGRTPTEREIERVCRSRLEDFVAPEEVPFRAELPKTPSGKIRKESLAEMPLGQPGQRPCSGWGR